LETCLKKAFSCEKINYLMLMMIDPDVHFHVIPRYSGPIVFAEKEFIDAAWPGPPDLARINQTDDVVNRQIIDYLCKNWQH
jgi:diadenosine tetraphosphate (Ap4A) HIT family hydrolase